VLTLRRAIEEDAATILALVRELATYERAPDSVVATEASFVRHGFGERPLFQVQIAEWSGEVVGFALYFFGFSTWTGAPVLYLEDLFVRPAFRKRHIGKELMRALAREAVARGCGRFVWQVLDWNQPAIDFYETLGATVLREWLTVRVEGDALLRLASEEAGPS
jgi:GNAT superfamily N-acetyltransferase